MMVGKRIMAETVWSNKKNCDFLHYLKFEFMQLCFFGSYLLLCLLQIYGFDLRTKNKYQIEQLRFNCCQLALWCFSVVHALQIAWFLIVIYFVNKN